MSMTTAQILRAARELIADERHWTTNVLARDAGGCLTMVASDDATCFCAVGALLKATGRSGITAARRAIEDAAGIERSRVFEWNDTHTHAEVLAAFDRAIATEEAK